MTESEWLASEDPRAMLAYLLGTDAVPDGQTSRGRHRAATDRRLRLFAAGCCRLVWPLLTDPRSRKAVEVAERYADGLATAAERGAAAREALVAYARSVPVYPPDMAALPNGRAVNAFAAAANACRGDDQVRAVLAQTREAGVGPAAQAALLRDVCGSPFWPREDYALCAACGLWFVPDRRRYYLCPGCGSKGPFTRSRLPHPWLTKTILALTRAACDTPREVPCGRCGGGGRWTYTKREPVRCSDCEGTGRTSDGLLGPDRLAVLADALEEAGCREELLRHLRGQEKAPPGWYRCRGCGREWKPAHKYDDCGGAACEGLEEPAEWIALRGPHAKGCWALDLVLGRA